MFLRYALTLIFLLQAVSALASGWLLNPYQFAVAPASDPTPDYQWSLDDNASGATVVAAYGGVNGTLVGETDTSAMHSADYIEGSGSFAFDNNDVVRSTTPSSVFVDEVVTIQWSVKGDTSGPGHAYCRFVSATNNNGVIINRNNSDTSLNIRFNTISHILTISDMDTGNWETYRAVIDTGATNKIEVYHKTGTGAWGLDAYSTGALEDILDNGSGVVYFGAYDQTYTWGNASGTYLADGLTIWNSAVKPPGF